MAIQKKDSPYISEFERDVLCLANNKVSFPNIACRYDIAVEDVHKTYYEALEKVHILISEEGTDLISYPFYCDDIESFILRMGMSEMDEEYKKMLTLSIECARNFPTKLDNLLEDFYPTIAAELNVPTTRVRNYLRRIFSNSFQKINCESILFFAQMGVRNIRDVRMDRLLRAAVKCIDEEDARGGELYNQKNNL